MSQDRLIRVFELAYECLRQKINGGRIRVENEASLQLQFLQLQFAGIKKSVGELLEIHRDDRDEEEALKKLAAHLLSLTAQAVATAEQAGELIEVNCDAQDEIPHSRSRV